MKRDKKEKVLEALERSLGIITPACKEVGITRDTFYRWLREDEDFKNKVEEINELQGDFVENQLFKKIKEGSERSILFYMKYKGRNRGYTERIDIDANVKGNIDISKLFGFEDDKTKE